IPEREQHVAWYSLEQLQARADDLQSQEGQEKPQQALVHTMCSLLPVVSLALLPNLWEMIREAVLKSSPSQASHLCHFLYETIATNYDYTRKRKCLLSFLSLLEEVRELHHISFAQPTAKL